MSKFEDWYDRRSFETIVLLGLSPLVLVALVLIVCALVWG